MRDSTTWALSTAAEPLVSKESDLSIGSILPTIDVPRKFHGRRNAVGVWSPFGQTFSGSKAPHCPRYGVGGYDFN